VGGRWFDCGRREESWGGEFGRKSSSCQTCRQYRTKTNQHEYFSKMVKKLERKILKYGENPELRSIRNNKQTFTTPEFPKDPAKRIESQKKQ